MTTPSERARVIALGIDLGEKATRIPGGLAVSRALGDHFLKSENSGLIADPFISELFELGPQDTHIILARCENLKKKKTIFFLKFCSDALWDMMSPQEAVDSVLQEGE